MAVSDYQIRNVIKIYMKNMKVRMGSARTGEDSVLISEEGMKKVFFDRIGEKMAERLKKAREE